MSLMEANKKEEGIAALVAAVAVLLLALLGFLLYR
jgi:hypothetical protein